MPELSAGRKQRNAKSVLFKGKTLGQLTVTELIIECYEANKTLADIDKNLVKVYDLVSDCLP